MPLLCLVVCFGKLACHTGLKTRVLVYRIVKRVTCYYFVLGVGLDIVLWVEALPTVCVEVEKLCGRLTFQFVLTDVLELTQGSVTDKQLDEVIVLAG